MDSSNIKRCNMNKNKRKKEHILNNAIASVEMEGYKLSEYEKKLCLNVLNGEMTKEEFINALLKTIETDNFTME